MKIIRRFRDSRHQRLFCGVLLSIAAVLSLSKPADALDFRGLSTVDDLACAFDPGCALPRGGVSDFMVVLDPSGAVYASLVAFANEEADNIYYFDPAVVAPDAQATVLTFLVDDDGAFSDALGTLPSLPGFPLPSPVLGFVSDNFALLGGNPIPGGIVEIPGAPIGLVMEPGSVNTVGYDATVYLDPALRAAGFAAVFYSDIDAAPVPEPGTLAFLGFGLAALGFHRRKKT